MNVQANDSAQTFYYMSVDAGDGIMKTITRAIQYAINNNAVVALLFNGIYLFVRGTDNDGAILQRYFDAVNQRSDRSGPRLDFAELSTARGDLLDPAACQEYADKLLSEFDFVAKFPTLLIAWLGQFADAVNHFGVHFDASQLETNLRSLGYKPNEYVGVSPDKIKTDQRKIERYIVGQVIQGLIAIKTMLPVTSALADLYLDLFPRVKISSSKPTTSQQAKHGRLGYDAHEKARHGCLPEGFDQWDLATSNGWTVAHTAALSGLLPEGFTQWSLADKDGRTVAHVAAKHGHLPADFDLWEIADEDGWTVAHEAAFYEHLPEGFNRWGLADKDGQTVAHEAAWTGRLPADFNQWSLADKDGWTVAHDAVCFNRLPTDFDRWDLSDNQGWTLAHTAARHGRLPEGFSQWSLANESGWTVAHEAVCFNRLPKDFSQWDLTNSQGSTVAHVAARYGHLPKNFDRWDLADDQGWTVAHEVVRFNRLPTDFDRWDLSDNQGRTVAHTAARYGHLPDDFNQRGSCG